MSLGEGVREIRGLCLRFTGTSAVHPDIGRWLNGEAGLHRAIAETYIPLFSTLSDLAEHEVPARLTLSISPVLAEQLADPLVAQHFESYLLERAERAAAMSRRFERAGDLHARYLAHWYEDFYNRTLAVYRGRFHRDLLGAARRLQDSGHLEIAATSATHALPATAGARIGGRGAAEHRLAGVIGGRSASDPKAIWLPRRATGRASRST